MKWKLNLRLLPLSLILIPLLVFGILISNRSEKSYVYAKVKVSQGFWWASTAEPPYWFTNIVQKGDAEKNILGQAVAEITEVRYYPTESTPDVSGYNIYFMVKLDASQNARTGKYHYNRATLVAGAPLDLETQRSQISGTIIEVSPDPISENYVEKEIMLTKKAAYPWEFEAIRVGDTYNDGEEEVFEILAKDQRQVASISQDTFGNLLPSNLDSLRYITIRAKIRVKEKNGQYIFGEEKTLNAGSEFIIRTNLYELLEYEISSIR